MSEIKRWNCFVMVDDDGNAHQVSRPVPDGEWVKYDDYSTLESECDSLHEMLDVYIKMQDEQDEKMAHLEKQVERAISTLDDMKGRSKVATSMIHVLLRDLKGFDEVKDE